VTRRLLASFALAPLLLVPKCGWMFQTGSGTHTGVYNDPATHVAWAQVIPVGDDQSSVKNVAAVCIDIDGYVHLGTPMNADDPPPAAKLPSGSYLAQAACLWKWAKSVTVFPARTPRSIVIS
jgi:hypothetical protein